MILLFDSGNTRLKWALAVADEAASEPRIVAGGSVEHGDYNAQYLPDRCNASAEITDSVRAWQLENSEQQESEITEIWVSSVAGVEKNRQLAELCEQCFQCAPIFVQVSKRACGIRNDYLSLDRLGVDRWVAAMGVSASSSINRVIVDAGTAVTVDLVSADNVFMGGAILPGARLMHDALVGETAGIKSVQIDVSTVLGRNTEECVNVGAKYGLVGAIDRVVDEFSAVLHNNSPWQVVLCGGDAGWLGPLMKTSWPLHHKPDLIFDGLLNLRQFSESR